MYTRAPRVIFTNKPIMSKNPNLNTENLRVHFSRTFAVLFYGVKFSCCFELSFKQICYPFVWNLRNEGFFIEAKCCSQFNKIAIYISTEFGL